MMAIRKDIPDKSFVTITKEEDIETSLVPAMNFFSEDAYEIEDDFSDASEGSHWSIIGIEEKEEVNLNFFYDSDDEI